MEQARSLREEFAADHPSLDWYAARSLAQGLQADDAFRRPQVTTHQTDVSDPDAVNEAISNIVSEHGRIDNLVTSAGFTENFSAISYPFDRLQRLWGVVVNGTYLFSTGVARHLIDRRAAGNIVLIGSMSGSIVNVPQPQAPYNAAKAAVRHLAASFAVEWASYGIRVNCISPGYMLTSLSVTPRLRIQPPLLTNALHVFSTRNILEASPDIHSQWTSLIPLGKIGHPKDVMGAVVFLLSDGSRYVTGADLRIDGGYSLI